MRFLPSACSSATSIALAIGLGAGGPALADSPAAVDVPVQRFTIPPRVAPRAPSTSEMSIELTSRDALLAHRTDHTITVLDGPMPGKTWPLGPSDRALLVATTNDRNERTVRVLAVEEACDWHEPLAAFEDVTVNPAARTFAFTRDLPGPQPIAMRWESSAAGVHLQRGAAIGWYRARSIAARRELAEVVDRGSDCTQALRDDGPRAAALAVSIYAWSIALGADVLQARERLATDLDAAPECTLALVNSPGWRAEARSGAITLGEAISDGRLHASASDSSECVSVPVAVEIRATR